MCISWSKYAFKIALIMFFTIWNGEAFAYSIKYNRPYIVVDAVTGEILAQQNIFQPWFPASLTKMMTSYLAFKAMANGDLTKNSHIILSKYDVGQPPSKSGYRAGTILTLDTALKIMLVKSTNDIASAIGHSVAKNNAVFVAMMNEQAKTLGMYQTHFASANGLPNSHNYSTARDLALLAIAIRRDFPQYTYYFNIQALDLDETNKIVLNSNNLLGHFYGINGMKTGYICASGYNLVASAKRGQKELIAVILGASRLDIREEVAAALLEHGFAAFNIKAKNNIYNVKPPYIYNKVAPNLKAQMCSINAVKHRMHYLDRNFRPIMHSPYISNDIKTLEVLRLRPIYEPPLASKKLKQAKAK